LILGTLEDSSQQIIINAFNRGSSIPIEAFNINYFKRLLLAFIIANNISFRAITTSSFKKLLNYLYR
jgi:hypothetical protein